MSDLEHISKPLEDLVKEIDRLTATSDRRDAGAVRPLPDPTIDIQALEEVLAEISDDYEITIRELSRKQEVTDCFRALIVRGRPGA